MTKNTIKSMMIVLMLLAVGLYFISGTYARYTSTASGTGTVKVAKWAVAINGIDEEAETRTFTINFTDKANANVVDGYIAPASEVYADFEIDPTGSQVAIDYSFELGEVTAPEGSTVPEGLALDRVVTVTGSGENEEETALPLDGEEYKGTIELTSQDEALTDAEKVKVRVYVKWTENSDNTIDTAAGIEALQNLTMTVTATATQHID